MQGKAKSLGEQRKAEKNEGNSKESRGWQRKTEECRKRQELRGRQRRTESIGEQRKAEKNRGRQRRM